MSKADSTVFAVADMSCGKCADRVKKAILALHADADVQVDLPTGLVTVRPGVGDPGALAEVITEEGYPARLAESMS